MPRILKEQRAIQSKGGSVRHSFVAHLSGLVGVAMKRRAQRKKAKAEQVVMEETTRFVTEPTLEVRRAGTLAQALTEPAVVVVKPQTRAIRQQKTRRAA